MQSMDSTSRRASERRSPGQLLLEIARRSTHRLRKRLARSLPGRAGENVVPLHRWEAALLTRKRAAAVLEEIEKERARRHASSEGPSRSRSMDR